MQQLRSDSSEPPLLSVDLLADLEERWRYQGAPVLAALRPGFPTDEMDALAVTLGLSFPNELRVWWGWHDGANGDEELSPRRGFHSLRRALADTEAQRSLAATVADRSDELTADQIWPDHLLALTNDDAITVACDCSGRRTGPVPILAYDHEEIHDFDAAPQARSLGEAVRWWIDAFDAGVWRWNSANSAWDYKPDLLTPEQLRTRLV